MHKGQVSVSFGEGTSKVGPYLIPIDLFDTTAEAVGKLGEAGAVALINRDNATNIGNAIRAKAKAAVEAATKAGQTADGRACVIAAAKAVLSGAGAVTAKAGESLGAELE